MKGVELFVIVIVVATALGAVGYMMNPSPTGLQTFNNPPSQTVDSVLVLQTPFFLNLNDVFFDSDADTLTYETTDPAVLLDGSMLTFNPLALPAEDYLVIITVSDGANTLAKPLLFTMPPLELQSANTPSLQSDVNSIDANIAPEIPPVLQEKIEIAEQQTEIAEETIIGPEQEITLPPQNTRGTSDATISATNLSNCGSINDSVTQDTDLTSTTTCLTIIVSNIDINCNGFSITFNTGGGTATSGITGTGLSNITIRNCRVIDNTVAGANNVPIRLTSLTDSEIHDNIIQSNGTSTNHGILLTSPSNVSVYSNTVRATGTTTDNDGIQLLNSATNTTINNNNVFAVGTSGIAGVTMTLTAASSTATNNSITGNTIAPTGTSNSVGVQIAGAATNAQVNLTRITGNTISLAGGSATTNDDGIAVGANTLFINNTVIEGNTVILSDVLDEGIDLVTNRNDTQAHIGSNTFTGPGYGIRVSRQNTHFKQNISTSNTINGQTIYYYGGIGDSPACPGVHTGNAGELNLIECSINTLSSGTISGPVFIYNVSFLVVDALISQAKGDQDVPAFGIYGAASNVIINRSTFSSFTGFDNSAFLVNVALNDFFVANNTFNITDGSTGGIAFDANPAIGIGNARILDNTFFGNNTDDVIQLDGSVIVFSNNTVIVDDSNSQDAGLRNFADNINITNNTFSGIADENIIESIASNVTIADNYIIGEVTSNSFVDFSGANYNITNNIFVDNGTTDYLAMLEISGLFYNNSVYKTGTQGFHLLLAGGSNLQVVNNTLVMAFTPGNEYGGIEVETNSNVTIADNHINVSGRGSGETGPLSAVFVDRGREITIANNTFLLNGTGNISAIAFEGGNNSIVTNNSMIVTSTGSITYGVFLTRRPTTFISQNNTFTNNTIVLNGTSRTKGFLLLTSSNNTIENNSIQTNGTENDNQGIEVNSSSFNNTIRSNRIITNGLGANNYGVYVNNGSNLTTISSNIIVTNGTTRNHGIFNTGSDSGTFSNNSVLANGSGDTNHGIRLETSQNVSITNNDVRTEGAGQDGQAIVLNTGNYNNITYNRVTANAAGAFSYGIGYYTANHGTVSFNNVTTNGTSQNQGIKVEFVSTNTTVNNNNILTAGSAGSNIGITNNFNSDNNTFQNNIISTRGTTQNHGIRCAAYSTNTTFTNTTISTQGTDTYAINFGSNNQPGCGTITFNNTLLVNTTHWISAFKDGNTSTFWNTTFETDNGSINIPQNFTLNTSINLTKNLLNISFNNSLLNSTNLSNYNISINTTAQITLHGLNFSDASVVVDYEDDGTFVSCAAPTCNESSYNGSTFVFNVSSFTSYAASEFTVSANDTCPGTITGSLTLTSDINGTTLGGGNCIETTTPNIMIDCQGYVLTGDNVSTAIFVNADNVTTENCVMTDWDFGIVYEITNDGIVQNNTVNNTVSDSILIHANNRTLAQHNRLNRTGSRGIAVTGQLFALNANNTIYNNTVGGQGSTCFFGGVYPHTVQNTAFQDNIGFNCSTALSLGTSSASVQNLTTYDSGSVSVGGAATATITNLFMHRGGGISIIDSGVSAANVYIANATQGLSVSNLSGFPATGTETAGMLFTNITILSESPQWLFTSGLQDPSNTIVNFTFGSNNGSVQWRGTYTLPENSNAGDPLTGELGFNITANLTQLNSTFLQFLNTSARVSLFGLPFTNPALRVDFENDGTFADCAAPQCQNSTYSAGNLTFDVISFTGYAASEATVSFSPACPYVMNESTTMDENLTCDGTAFMINASNVVLDCAGYYINHSNLEDETYGIVSTAQTNVTIRNCNILLGSPDTFQPHDIFLNYTNLSVITNTTTQTISNSQADSLRMNHGYNNTIILNTFNSTVGSGITLFNSSNNTIENMSATSDSFYGLWFEAYSSDNVVRNYTAVTTSSEAMRFEIQSNDNLIENVSGVSITDQGIEVVTLENLTIRNSNFRGGSGEAFRLVFTNNTLVDNVTAISASGFGLDLDFARNSTITNSYFYSGDNWVVVVRESTSRSNITNVSIGTNIGVPLRFGLVTPPPQNNTFDNITLTINTSSSASWIQTTTAITNNTLRNVLFNASNGTIRIVNASDVPTDIDLNATHLNVSYNNSFINTTNGNASWLNATGQVTLYNLTFTDPRPLIDVNDDGTFVDCSSPECDEISYTGGTFVFNTSHFTSHAASETVNASAACPIDINTSTTLIGNITCPATALNITVSNLELDCAGYNISYAHNFSGYGINATNVTNVTVKNCYVFQGNLSLGSTGGIVFLGANNSTIMNSTAIANGTLSAGIRIALGGNNTIFDSVAIDNSSTALSLTSTFGFTPANNTLTNVTGISDLSVGISISSAGNTLSNSTGTTNNAIGIDVGGNNNALFNVTGIGGTGGTGIRLLPGTSGTSLVNSNGTGGTDGITIFGTSHTVQNNYGFGNFGLGISVTAGGLTITNNTGQSNLNAGIGIINNNNNVIQHSTAVSSAFSGLQINFGSNNTVTNTTLLSNTNAALRIRTSSANNTLTNITLETNRTWIAVDDTSAANNITLALFENRANGSILIINRTTIPANTTVGLAAINTSLNNSFLNSSNTSFLNTSAQITLRSIAFIDPRPRVDFEDDGIFNNCNPPTCVEVSYAGGEYVFNVSHFTSYAAQENLTFVINLSAEKADTSDPVARGSTLSYTITLNNSGNGTAYNVTVFELYPAEISFVSGQPTPIGNDTFSVGDLAPGAGFVVNITVNVSSAAANGTLINNTVNVTFSNDSGENFSFLDSELTTVLGAPVLVSIKSDTPDPVVKGSTLNYSILLNNTGDDTAFNVTLSENYPVGVSFVTAQPTPTGNDTFAIGTLLPNQTFLVNVTVTVGSNVANGTILNNTVNASWRNVSGEQGGVSDSELTTVLGIAAITVVKTDSPDPVNNGSVLSYTITITNTGDEIAYNVTAVDGYPVNVSLTTTAPAPTSGNDTFTLGDLLPGASTTINITLTVDSNMTSGVLNNTVNVTFDNSSGVNVTTTAFQATTVTMPGVPAAPSGGGGGGSGSAGFRMANITREQPAQIVPIAWPMVAPVQTPPQQTESETLTEELSGQETQPPAAQEQEIRGESTSTENETSQSTITTNKNVLYILGSAFALLAMVLLLLMNRTTSHDGIPKPLAQKLAAQKLKQPKIIQSLQMDKLNKEFAEIDSLLSKIDKKGKR